MQKALRKTYTLFLFLIFILCFFLTQSVADQNNPPIKNGENSLSILSGNQTRHYALYLPLGYDQKAPLPLVFFFHGTGGKPKMGMAVTDFDKVADKKILLLWHLKAFFSSWGGIVGMQTSTQQV